MLKILHARLQQYVKQELLDAPAGFRKGSESRDQIANIHWIIEKAREFQKISTFASLISICLDSLRQMGKRNLCCPEADGQKKPLLISRLQILIEFRWRRGK